MADYVASGKALASTANTNLIELRTTTTDRARIQEIGVFSEAATALNLALFRTTVIGTAGTAVTVVKQNPADGAPSITVVTAPTGGTLEATALRRAFFGAAAGSAVIWTFPPGQELLVPVSGSIIIRNDGAAGPAFTWYITYDE